MPTTPSAPLARPVAGPEDFADVFGVSRETLKRLALFAERLRAWQKAVNLVSPETLGEIWHRHFADSAQLLTLAPDVDATWLDLGAGAGFPGLVVAILMAERGTGRVHLVESRARRCAFLREVARATGAPVEVHQTRIEALAESASLPPFAVVTARALAPLDRLLGLAAPFFSETTMGLFPKGRAADDEIAAARGPWRFQCETRPSLTDSEGRIIVIRHLEKRGAR